MVILETIVTGFVDKFPKLGINAFVRFATTVTVAAVLFCCGLPMTSQVLLHRILPLKHISPQHIISSETITQEDKNTARKQKQKH